MKQKRVCGENSTIEKKYDPPIRNKCFVGQAVSGPAKCLCEGDDRE